MTQNVYDFMFLVSFCLYVFCIYISMSFVSMSLCLTLFFLPHFLTFFLFTIFLNTFVSLSFLLFRIRSKIDKADTVRRRIWKAKVAKNFFAQVIYFSHELESLWVVIYLLNNFSSFSLNHLSKFLIENFKMKISKFTIRAFSAALAAKHKINIKIELNF
jgi:hypothetical protein